MIRKTAIFLVFISVFTVSCDKKLPAEDQQRLQKEADAQKIQRVTENQMVEFIQMRGEKIESILDSAIDRQSAELMLSEYLGEEFPLSYVMPREATQGELNEVMQAYLYSIANEEGIGANLQKLDNGNIMYTVPDVSDSAGIKVLKGIWKVEFIRKNMVNEIFSQEDQE